MHKNEISPFPSGIIYIDATAAKLSLHKTPKTEAETIDMQAQIQRINNSKRSKVVERKKERKKERKQKKERKKYCPSPAK